SYIHLLIGSTNGRRTGPSCGVSRRNSVRADAARSHRQHARTGRSQKGRRALRSRQRRRVHRHPRRKKIRHPRGRHRDGRWLLDQAPKDAKAAGVTRLVEFRAEDALKANISKATVITLYMLPWFNEAMKPSFEKQLKPGARIVAHDFGIAGWEPDQTVKLPGYELKVGGYKHQHTLYLWKMSKDRS